MKVDEIGFSVNLNDSDGDVWDKCVLLHLKPSGTILRFNDSAELTKFANKILSMIPEIEENES